MSSHPSPAEKHGLHLDEANRVRALARHEEKIRERTRLQLVAPFVQEPAPREFTTPIPHRYRTAVFVDAMDLPGAKHTDFEGCVV